MKRYLIFIVGILLLTESISFCALPDVDLEIVGPAVVDLAQPTFGEKVTVSLFIYNYGPENVTGPVKVSWMVNGKNIGQSIIMGLPAGEQKEIKNSFKVKDKVNKVKASVVTTMVPYADNYADNNVYEEEIAFTNLNANESSTQNQQDQGTLNSEEITKKGRGKNRVEEPQEGSEGSGTKTGGNTGGQIGEGSTSESSSSSNSSSKESNNQTSSPGGDNKQNPTGVNNNTGSNASSRESGVNKKTYSSPVFDDSELTRMFASYVTSYLKLSAKVSLMLVQETDTNSKNAVSELKKDLETMHTTLVSINQLCAGNTSSSHQANIDWNSIKSLISALESKIEPFEELESLGEEYIDNTENFISKAQDFLKK